MMMSGEEEDTAAESRGSPPALPPDSPGSSVSTRMQEEYTELLRYAVGMPGPDTGTMGSSDAAFKPVSRSGGSSSRQTPVDQKQDEETPGMMGENFAEGDENSNSIYPGQLPMLDNLTAGGLHEHAQYNKSMSKTTTKSSSKYEEYTTTSSTIVGPAVSEMGDKLDTWLGTLKHDILAELNKSITKALEQQTRIHRQETQEILKEKQGLEREVNRLSELVNTCEQSMGRKDTLIENLTEALNKQRDKVTMAQAFYQTKAEAVDAKREKFVENLASKHREKQLAEKVLRSWFSVIQTKWRKRVERASMEQAQNVCKQLSSDYEEKVKAMCMEIESLEKKVKCLQKEREQYAEQVKKAFMRGVCALNQEAMAAFVSEEKSCGTQTSAPPRGPDSSLSNVTANNVNINNNLEGSFPHKDDHPAKSLPADLTVTAVPDWYPDGGQHQSMPSMSTGHPQKSKSKQPKSRSRPTTAPSSGSKSLGVVGHSGSLAPPMASIVVERHNPVTKQTVGKATASRYPKQSSSEGGTGSHSKHGSTSSMFRSQPAPQTTQTFRPLAGQTFSPTASHSQSPGIKVVE